MFKVALVADASGRYAHVWGTPRTWSDFIHQLEDAGCEVIEDHTQEWDGCDQREVAEDCLTVHQLLDDTDFIPF